MLPDIQNYWSQRLEQARLWVPCALASSSHPHLPRRSCTCVKHSAEELEHSKSVMNLAIITLSHQILELTRCFIVDTRNKGSSRSLNVCIKFPHLFSCLLIKSNFLAPYDKPLIWLILHLVSVGSSISLRFLPQLVANSESASNVSYHLLEMETICLKSRFKTCFLLNSRNHFYIPNSHLCQLAYCTTDFHP